jgi:hypothetical protein
MSKLEKDYCAEIFCYFLHFIGGKSWSVPSAALFG